MKYPPSQYPEGDWRRSYEGYDWRRMMTGWVYPIKFIKWGPEALKQDAKGNWYSELATVEYVEAGGRWQCVVDASVNGGMSTYVR
jgi:hypothetical protein